VGTMFVSSTTRRLVTVSATNGVVTPRSVTILQFNPQCECGTAATLPLDAAWAAILLCGRVPVHPFGSSLRVPCLFACLRGSPGLRLCGNTVRGDWLQLCG
jgi:hypothetical protein